MLRRTEVVFCSVGAFVMILATLASAASLVPQARWFASSHQWLSPTPKRDRSLSLFNDDMGVRCFGKGEATEIAAVHDAPKYKTLLTVLRACSVGSASLALVAFGFWLTCCCGSRRVLRWVCVGCSSLALVSQVGSLLVFREVMVFLVGGCESYCDCVMPAAHMMLAEGSNCSSRYEMGLYAALLAAVLDAISSITATSLICCCGGSRRSPSDVYDSAPQDGGPNAPSPAINQAGFSHELMARHDETCTKALPPRTEAEHFADSDESALFVDVGPPLRLPPVADVPLEAPEYVVQYEWGWDRVDIRCGEGDRVTLRCFYYNAQFRVVVDTSGYAFDCSTEQWRKIRNWDALRSQFLHL